VGRLQSVGLGFMISIKSYLSGSMVPTDAARSVH